MGSFVLYRRHRRRRPRRPPQGAAAVKLFTNSYFEGIRDANTPGDKCSIMEIVSACLFVSWLVGLFILGSIVDRLVLRCSWYMV